MHGILVYRGGTLVVEEYFYGDDRDRLHQMRSATKSVVSALVGAAIDRGAGKGRNGIHLAPFVNHSPRQGAVAACASAQEGIAVATC